MDNPLEHLFQELRSEGKLDSQGHFTLDVARALEKMRQFQLQDARLYVLNLVAASVANGARYIRLESTQEGFSLEADGEGYTFEQLSEIFSSVFIANDQSKRSLQELAIGLFGTRGLQVKQLTLESWHADTGARMTILDGKLEIAQLSQTPFETDALTTRLTLKEKATLLDSAYGLLGKIRKTRPVTMEAEYLRGFCTYSPVHLHLNGEPISLPVPAGAVAVALEFIGPNDRRFGLTGELSDKIVQTREGPHAAVLILESRTLPGDPLTVVVNGVNFIETEMKPAYANARVVIEADHLRKDFSQARLLRDEAFTDLLEWINVQLDWLAAEFLTRTTEDEGLVVNTLGLRLRERLPNKQPSREGGLALAREMADFKLFRLLHAGPISIAALARQYMRHGYLPYIETRHEVPPMIPPVLADKSAIIQCTSSRASLLDAFFYKSLRKLELHKVRLDRLQQPASLGNMPRLPEGDYLVRRISEHTRLEVGVPAEFPHAAVRYTLYRDGQPGRTVVHDWSTWLPNGLDICADTAQTSDDPENENPSFEWKRVETAVCSMLSEMIEALLWDYPPEEPVRSWAAAHLLEYFWLASQRVRGESPADFYYRMSDEEARSRLKFFDLKALARQPLLQASTGELLTIESIYREPRETELIPDELPPFEAEGPPRLWIRKRELEILEAFLGRPLRSEG